VSDAIRLTEDQRQVVRRRDGHLQVEAGAGSGKTLLVVEKLAHELGYTEVDGQRADDPLELDQVGAITFTRKAAGELKERLRGRIRSLAEAERGRARERWAERSFAVDEAPIGTIDAFAGQLIRDYGALAGVEAGFEILDPGDAAALRREVAEGAIRRAVEERVGGAQLLVRQYGYGRSVRVVSDALDDADGLLRVLGRRGRGPDWERLGIEPGDADRALEERAEQVLGFLERAYDRYTDRLEEDGVLDHTHVLIRACDLARRPEVQGAYRSDTRLLVVDEHQDTSLLQMVLLFRLAGLPGWTGLPDDEPVPFPALGDGRPALRLVLVGDPKQSIYGWRNADIRLWRKSRRVLEDAGGTYRALGDTFRPRPALSRFHDEFLGTVMPDPDEESPAFEAPYRPLRPRRPAWDHADANTNGDGKSDGSGASGGGPDPAAEAPPVEILLSEAGGSERVAEAVADRVKEILDRPEEHPVRERRPDGTEEARPVRPRDIAVLSRSLKRSARHYEWALRQRGVDCHVYGGSGLYGRREIQDLVHMLRTVSDPHDPVALTAFLRSPLGGVDDVTLAELAAESTAAAAPAESVGSLFDALRDAGDIVSREEGARRALRAAELVEELRDYAERVPHDRLLEIALEESGYRTFLAGAPDSPVGLRNVAKLLRIARRAGREPLSHFVERLDARVKRADPEEEAPLYTPEDDLVTISTIHRAKGLEWPYVFVTELDQPMFWRVKDDRPYLSGRFGLVLPLEVTVEQPGPYGDTASLGQPRRWEAYFEHATRREYAEAKRLTYVACTRARDRLFLAGSPYRDRDGGIRRPRSLEDNSLEYLHKHTPMVWLQAVYDELLAPGEHASVTVGEADDDGPAFEAPLRWIEDAADEEGPADAGEHEEEDPEEGGGGGGAVRRGWPRPLFGEARPEAGDGGAPSAGDGEADGWPPEVERRLQRLGGRSPDRSTYSPTEVMTYDRCPQRHRLRYRHGISRPEVEVRTDVPLTHQIPPEIRGKMLHQFFARVEEDWDDATMREQMEEIFLRAYPMAHETAGENAGRLLSHARRFLESPLYRELREAGEERRELPFYYRLEEDVRISGVIDWMARLPDSGGWRIVDVKVGRFESVDPTDEELRERVRRYRSQAALYTLAADEALKPLEQEVDQFAFFFTDPGEPVTLDVTDGWLARERERLLGLIAEIRGGEYDGPSCEPEEGCRACEYVRSTGATA